MKKVMLIMAAALLMLTQCKKENETPNGPAEGTMKMTVTAGPGRTSIDTGNGAITWSEGDKLYVSDGSNWLGSLTLVGEGGTANGTFTGDVAGIGDGTTPCHFFYLGHDNGMTEPTGSAAASISMAAQDGTLAGAMKYHLGYGNTDVTVTEGEATGSVIMNTKIAIAHINFTDGTQAYTGSLTMGGTGISNTMTISPDGTFTGGGNGGITIGATTEGGKYVTLIPTTGTDRVDVAFSGDAAKGSMTFLAGIQANKFYGMSNAMVVTVKPIRFTVGMDGDTPITVEFAHGNLWADATDAENPVFHFEEHQWDFQLGVKNVDEWGFGKWEPSHVIHFYWSKTASVAYAENYSESGTSTSDVFFTNATETTANPNFTVNGETGTWRTLSKAEWDYLLARSDGSLKAWVTLTDVSVSGLVLLPDGSTAIASGITTSSALADAGAVFLPEAGDRNGTNVYHVGFYSYYWSSTPDGSDYSYNFFFYPDETFTSQSYRNSGYAVRLVRSAS